MKKGAGCLNGLILALDVMTSYILGSLLRSPILESPIYVIFAFWTLIVVWLNYIAYKIIKEITR
jgi:uncharacterized membrane protein YcaP (DUF421 family)